MELLENTMSNLISLRKFTKIKNVKLHSKSSGVASTHCRGGKNEKGDFLTNLNLDILTFILAKSLD